MVIMKHAHALHFVLPPPMIQHHKFKRTVAPYQGLTVCSLILKQCASQIEKTHLLFNQYFLDNTKLWDR